MIKGYHWTTEEAALVAELFLQGHTYKDIAKQVGRTYGAVARKVYCLRADGVITEDQRKGRVECQPLTPSEPADTEAQQEPEPTPAEIRKQDQQQLRDAALHTPIDTKPLEKIRALESEVATLRQQLTWSQRADSEVRTGGLLTLRASDHHYGDVNHLISCGASMASKVVKLVEMYAPDRIQIIAGDDWIAGSGIFKEQDLEMATTDVQAQIVYGAMKARKMLQDIRAVSSAPILWRVLRGNHDYAKGVSMTESLYLRMDNLNRDLDDVQFEMNWDSVTANLAHEGTYNVLVKHGTGNSNNSPNSPRFISDVKDEIIRKQRKMQPEEQYRRVLSGHTHWYSVGLERQVGLLWDTTGGLQRNTRVKLGMNSRPVGWIVYVSPPGLRDEILAPIGVQPDQETYEREIADPHLHLLNQKDCAEEVANYENIMRQRGSFGEGSSFGENNRGRW